MASTPQLSDSSTLLQRKIMHPKQKKSYKIAFVGPVSRPPSPASLVIRLGYEPSEIQILKSIF